MSRIMVGASGICAYRVEVHVCTSTLLRIVSDLYIMCCVVGIT